MERGGGSGRDLRTVTWRPIPFRELNGEIIQIQQRFRDSATNGSVANRNRDVRTGTGFSGEMMTTIWDMLTKNQAAPQEEPVGVG